DKLNELRAQIIAMNECSLNSLPCMSAAASRSIDPSHYRTRSRFNETMHSRHLATPDEPRAVCSNNDSNLTVRGKTGQRKDRDYAGSRERGAMEILVLRGELHRPERLKGLRRLPAATGRERHRIHVHIGVVGRRFL